MASGIALDDAAIMSTVLESILYGFSLLMFVGAIWVLARERGRQGSNWPYISIAIVLLMLSTAHLVIDIVRIDQGLVGYRNTFPGGPVAFFSDVANNTFVIKNAIYTVQALLGDGGVIYRCYAVWRSIWILILPCMLWCGVAVTGFSAVYSVSQASNPSNIYVKETGQWISAFFATALATNLLSSVLLAYRIWTIERSIASVRVSKRNTMISVLRVLFDAAVPLYSTSLFIALLCFANSNNGQYVVSDMITPIISIAFYTILIRIVLSRRGQKYVSKTRSGTRTTTVAAQSRGMKPLQIHISQYSTNDSTPPYGHASPKGEMENSSLRDGGSNDAIAVI